MVETLQWSGRARLARAAGFALLATLVTLASVPLAAEFIPGDVNDDGSFNITDPTVLRRALVGLGPGIAQMCLLPSCGDGIVNQESESCDPPQDAACPGQCRESCICPPASTCGNGVVDSPVESCDDGDLILFDDCPDGPAGTCQLAVCGDRIPNLFGPSLPFEQCDDGNATDTDACSNACTLPGTCGDGSFDGGVESCDTDSATGLPVLSDTLPGDCSSVCRTDCTCPRCGDGVADFARGEQCDDRNTTAGDGCDGTCQLEVSASCGNGVVETGNQERCDDGGNAPGDGCSASCQLERLGLSCGDGFVGVGEVCDVGIEICPDGTTGCIGGADCPAPGVLPQTCLNAGDDTCNTTCSSLNIARAFHDPGTGQVTIASDNTYLWYADAITGQISRIDIRACIAHHAATSSPCNDAPDPGCSDPCQTQLVLNPASPTDPVNNLMRPFALTSDGEKLWFLAGGAVAAEGCIAAQREAYIYELDIAACDTALAGGATDCDGLEVAVAGGASEHVDGAGAAARLQGLNGATYSGGFVYFLDGSCGTLRRYDPKTASVKTLVGDSSCTVGSTFQEGYGGLSPLAGGANLRSPRYLTSDASGFLYISDNAAHIIARYNTVTGYLERFVGDAVAGAGYGDAFDGRSAQLNRPRDLASDGTSLYVADFSNYTIRQVDLQTSRVTTLVGVPAPGANPATKCDLAFGRGAQPTTGAVFTKPLTMTFHFPTRSLFFFTAGGPVAAGCFGGPCTASQVTNLIWRIQ